MIDVDGLFEKYFRDFLAENAGKFTEEELENKVEGVYSEFGRTPQKELGGKTPAQYYAGFSTEELVEELGKRVKKGQSVSDYLYDAITERPDASSLLVGLVSTRENEELAVYAVNLLAAVGSEEGFGKYVEVLLDETAGESLAESVTEQLCDQADSVKETLLSVFDRAGKKGRGYIEEIFSCMSVDGRVTARLSDVFSSSPSGERGLYADYLARYGDERVLPLLIEGAKDPSLTYNDFKEIRFAIEALGGECPVVWKKNR